MIKERIGKVQRLLSSWGVDVLLVTESVDLYYLTGLTLSLGMLCIAQDEATLIVDGRYIENAKTGFPFRVLLSKGSPYSDKNVLELCHNKRVGFDSSKTNYQLYSRYKEGLERDGTTIVPLDNPIIRYLRKVKSKEEIILLKAAATLNKQGIDYAMSILKVGISEAEVARALEVFWLQNGGEGLAFETNVSFGANSSMPHHHADDTLLRDGDVVLMDVGVLKGSYCSDMTRTTFFGPADEEIEKIYNVVAKAQSLALDLCRPGAALGALDFAARDFIESKGYGDYFSHGLGHGLGLDVHEFPLVKNVDPYREELLEAGMVITIEPGIYLPGKGGIRIEDSIVITKSGYERLV